MNIEFTPEVQTVLDWVSQYKSCAVDDVPKDIIRQIRQMFQYEGRVSDPTSLRFSKGEYRGCLSRGRYADRVGLHHQFDLEAIIRYEDLTTIYSDEIITTPNIEDIL